MQAVEYLFDDRPAALIGGNARQGRRHAIRRRCAIGSRGDGTECLHVGVCGAFEGRQVVGHRWTKTVIGWRCDYRRITEERQRRGVETGDLEVICARRCPAQGRLLYFARQQVEIAVAGVGRVGLDRAVDTRLFGGRSACQLAGVIVHGSRVDALKGRQGRGILGLPQLAGDGGDLAPNIPVKDPFEHGLLNPGHVHGDAADSADILTGFVDRNRSAHGISGLVAYGEAVAPGDKAVRRAVGAGAGDAGSGQRRRRRNELASALVA